MGHVEQFGPIIACITIGESVQFNFKYNKIISLNVESGSMYIITGDARYRYQHGLTNTTDKTRYSLTFRTIKEEK